MAGFHGKNATLLLANSLSVVASGIMTNLSGDIYQAGSTERDWLFDADNDAFEIVYKKADQSWHKIDKNSAGINYAGGAVQIVGVEDIEMGPDFKNVLRSDLVEVTHKINQNRSWEVSFEQDTIDASVMGEFWGTSLPGIPRFTGTVDGLWLDSDKYEKAVVNASGIQIRRILRFRPTAEKNTYYQGAVRFSNWSLNASFDGPIEESLDFQGEGPLDLIKAGVPFFGPLF
jgi:hypothetical protein